MNNIHEWLTKCREHECGNKIFELQDNGGDFVVGHKCKCEESFGIRLDEVVMKDSTGFTDEEFSTIKEALSSEAGRLALMCSCFDANKLK